MPFPSEILSKPILIDSDQYNLLGPNINLVGYDTDIDQKSKTSKFISPNLLNWVESYEINGVKKTLFYSEYSTNFQVGDRVWIINGLYDNNKLIELDKYKKGRDGYKVLFIDKCKIVLDIDYIGTLPYKKYVNEDDFIKVHYVNTREKFINVNQQLTTRNGNLSYRFDIGNNNIIFAEGPGGDYTPVYSEIGYPFSSNITTPDGDLEIVNRNHISGYGVNLGILNSYGFFVRNGSSYWVDITKDFFYYGTFSTFTNKTNYKVKILGGDFSYKGFEFKEGFVYKWVVGPTMSTWEIDVDYLEPIITKSNFRNGIFGGKFNNGVYGNNKNKITWSGLNSKWYGGTLFNSNWTGGRFYSELSFEETYKSIIEDGGKPYQKINSNNNDGYGYNFIFNSEISNSIIYNGLIKKTKFVGITDNVVENHILSKTQSYNIEILGGYYENCDFTNTKINNSSLLNSYTLNTNIDNSKIINSQLNKSVVIDSTHISDNIIKILAYDEWNLSEYRYTNTDNSNFGSSEKYSILKLNNSDFNPNFFDGPKVTHKMYKFYISEKDYNRLKYGYNFYIKGLKIKTNPNSYSNFFEKKYRIGSWYDFIEGYTSDKFYNKFIIDKTYYKQGFENVAFLSTPSDNSHILNSDFINGNFRFLTTNNQDTSGPIPIPIQSNKYYTNVIGKNPNSNLYSIDIVISIQDFHRRVNKSGADGLSWLNFNYDTDIINGSRSTYLGDNIDISKAYIIDSDFESGIFENSDWNGGYNINYNCDTNISSLTGSGVYNISFSQNLLTVITNQYDGKKETNFEVGDIVYLNSVYYKNGDNEEVRLGDTYKVFSVNSNILNIEEISTNILTGLTQGGYFYTPLAENRWGYLSKFKFNKSKIKSGFFKRTYFTNSLIQNDVFDSDDIEMSNFEKNKKLVVSDSLFYDNNNIISSGTYIYSHFIGGSDKIIDGIIVSSIINGITFSKGSVISSTWLNGTFNGGTFHNSRSYNGVKDPDTPFYYSHNRKSYLRVGEVSSNVYNTRNSWVNGTFNGGKFYKSDWENGIFNGGTFYESKWYNGTFSNGRIGTKKTDNSKTRFYNGVIENGIVDSGTLYSEDPNYSGLSFSNLIWKNGIFNNGVFGSYNTTESKNYEIREIISIPQTSTQINNPISNSISYWSPLSGKIIKSYNVIPSKTYATSSVSNIYNTGGEKIDEIEIIVEISASNYNDSLSNLRFTLISPNGKMILVKAFDVGKGNKYNNIRFSTNDSNSIPINLPTQDSLIENNYSNEIFGNFKMDKSIKLDTTLYVNDEILLLNNSQIDGDWRLMVEYNYPQFNTSQSPIIDEFKLYFYWKEYNNQIMPNVDNKAIWYNGEFNGGQFINYAKWKNGVFNGGKFTSAYGWIESGNFLNNSTKEEDFSWENGTFNDGEFGNESLGENSTWFDGEFNGGEFKGRVWNNGIFSAGTFKGSGSNNPYGDMDLTSISNGFYLTSKASNFVNSFRNNFYGLWLNGIATTKKDKFIFNKKIPIILNKYKSASFKNILWANGIFKNERATIENSVWLAGRFENGIFRNGSFNPYVKRSDTTEYSFTPDMNVVNTDSVDESIWVNGIFENGDFYISRWLNGSFKGTAIGMIFENGISNYMNAYNVTWLNGTWKNGNWYGSPFKYNNNKVDNIFIKNILNRGYYIKYVGQENKIHFWNTFQFDWYSLSEHMIARPNRISIDPVPEFTNPLQPYIGGSGDSVSQVIQSISKFVVPPSPGNYQNSDFYSSTPRKNSSDDGVGVVAPGIQFTGNSSRDGGFSTPNQA